MKKIPLILIISVFFSLTHSLHAQNETKYQKEAYDFFHQIRFSKFSEDTLVIKDHLSNQGMFLGVVLADKFFHDSLLTDLEIKELSFQFHNDTSRVYLKKNGIEKSRLLSDAEINVIEKFDYQEGKCAYWKFSKPCFLRNYTICAFSYGICDSQSTLLYKKVSNKWIFVKRIGRITND
jgi:hypothetical protein